MEPLRVSPYHDCEPSLYHPPAEGGEPGPGLAHRERYRPRRTVFQDGGTGFILDIVSSDSLKSREFDCGQHNPQGRGR